MLHRFKVVKERSLLACLRLLRLMYIEIAGVLSVSDIKSQRLCLNAVPLEDKLVEGFVC